MNTKKISLLITILIFIIALFYWDEAQDVADKQEAQQKNRLFTFQPDTVSSVAYHDPSLEIRDFSIAHDNEKWKISSPVNSDASARDVNNLLDTISTFKYSKKFSSTEDKWQDFGLGEGARKITITFATKEKPIELVIGKNAPVGYSSYFRHSGSDDIFLGSQYLATATGKKLYDFRAKNFSDFDSEKISQFKYHTLGLEDIVITKEDNNLDIISPIHAKGDSFTISELFRALTEVKATEFLDAPVPKKYITALSTENAEFIFSWKDQQDTEYVLYLATIGENFYASFSPSKIIYGVSDEFQSKIAKKIFELRSKRIFDFNTSEISNVEINGTSYQKKENTWFADEEASKISVGALLIDLEYVSTLDFISVLDINIAKIISETPRHNFTLTLKDRLLKISLWDYSNDKFILQQGDAVSIIKKDIITSGLKEKTTMSKNSENGASTKQ